MSHCPGPQLLPESGCSIIVTPHPPAFPLTIVLNQDQHFTLDTVQDGDKVPHLLQKVLQSIVIKAGGTGDHRQSR